MYQKNKKRIVSINLGNFGSTGTIVKGISEIAENSGYEYYCIYPGNKSNKRKSKNDIIICSDFFRRVNEKLAYYTGLNGCFSFFSTFYVLYKLKKIKPQIIHLHNLHNSYINLFLLFNYIKKYDIEIVWTLHDCWAFTGQCPYFTMVKCEKWKTGCYDCPQYEEYPHSKFDCTKIMWKLKKKWFTGVKHLTIVTPSRWLANLVKESFLKIYPIRIINNGINLDIFKPIHSNFKERYKLKDKYILLGVAMPWSKRKGIDTFIQLASHLDVEKYQIVLVGTSNDDDKKLPSNIISIHKTNNLKELVEIYSAVDLFINPTREENYPTVNMEAIACGTPVVTFNVGGCSEIVTQDCGIVLKNNNISELLEIITKLTIHKSFTRENCINKAKKFNMNEKYKEYLNLYSKKF